MAVPRFILMLAVAGLWLPQLDSAVRAMRFSGPAGMVIGVDPEGGKLGVPTPEQAARLSAMREAHMGTRAVRPTPVHRADGSVSLDAHAWMREYYVVRAGTDGKLRPVCVDDKKNARRAMSETSRPAAEER